MKKIIIALVMFAGISSANAQEIKYGVRAGFNSAMITASAGGVSVSGSESGFFVGGFATIGISEKFSVQPEVLYASVKDLGQIQVPILAKYNFTNEIAVLAGPEIGFLSGNASGDKKFNYGITAGGSYDITENFIIDLRYNFGIANLSPGAGFTSTLSNFQVGVGYRF